MPDPVGRYFKLQAVQTSPPKTTDFPIYQAAKRANLNYVKLVRSGLHEVQFVVDVEDAKTLMGRKYAGTLEAHIFDNTRESDGDPVVDIRLWPLIPWRAEYITNKAVKITFKLAVGAQYAADWADGAWDASGYVELTDQIESPVMTDLPDLQEYLAGGRIGIDPYSGTNGGWADEELHADVTPTVKAAVEVGTHIFRRPSTRWQQLRMWEAICGVVFWYDLEDRTIHLVLADEQQPGLDAFKNPKFLVEDFPRIENGQPELWIHPDSYYLRTSRVDGGMSPYPIRNINTSLGLTIPPLYRSPIKGIRQNHYSSLYLPPLDIVNLSAGGLAATQQLIDDHAATFERAVKATERTYAAYNRASRRSDWYRLGGYHVVSLGAEIASITYQTGTTMVDFRDQRLPVWPSLPMLEGPKVTLVTATLNSRFSGPPRASFLATASAPHGGYWSIPKAFGFARGSYGSWGPIEVEDTLNLYPWLDVGDRVLCFWDGSRATIINAELAADVELQ